MYIYFSVYVKNRKAYCLAFLTIPETFTRLFCWNQDSHAEIHIYLRREKKVEAPRLFLAIFYDRKEFRKVLY